MKNSKSQARTRSADSDGFILVAVLWLLASLATFASIYGAYVINTAAAFRTYDDRLQATALVTGATELVAYLLSSKEEHHPTHGQFGYRMGQADVAVRFRSEAARIDLNAAPKELLAGLFAALGARRADAETYADRVIAWRTAPVQNRDPSGSSAQALEQGFAARGAPFPSVEELTLVRDVPMELVERALPLVTVFGGLGKVNVLEAAPEVMAALPDMTRERLNAVLAQRQASREDGRRVLALLGPAQAYATTDASKASRVTVQVKFDDGFQTSSEVVILAYQEGNTPYSVLFWRDNLDEPSATAALGMVSR
jgi:general secretion pathway protein K